MPDPYSFLKSETLPEQVHVLPCDIPFSWEGMNSDGQEILQEALRERDRLPEAFTGFVPTTSPGRAQVGPWPPRHQG